MLFATGCSATLDRTFASLLNGPVGLGLGILTLLLGLGLEQQARAQVPQNVITECSACGAEDVHAADLNGDGRPDVLSASLSDDKIAWYENKGGGTFSDPKVIITGTFFTTNDNPRSVYAADLNGDGQPDVLSASSRDDKIAWYENEGGGTFSDPKVITTEAEDGESVFATDLNGDGRPDVLSASSEFDGKIAWYENEGSGTFSDQKVITTDAGGAESVFAADLTGNGRPDVLSASFYDDKIAWYENEGAGTFSGRKVITTEVGRPQSVFAADLNGDDRPDVLSASSTDSKIAWYENTDDTLPVELAGFDARVNDGAVQLSWQTASETNNAGFRIQRRAGEGANGREGAWTTVGSVEGAGTTSQAQSYRFTDADLPYEADKLTYRLKQVDTDGSEHLSDEITVERGVDEVQLLGTYPNPARQQATVRYALPDKQEATIRLYDVLGRQVRTVVSGEQEGRHEQRLDTSRLSSGVYFLRLRAGGETETQRLTVVQ